MEVQNGPENFMGLPYALLFFRRFRYTDGKMIQTAADKGLMGICFTEHFDPDYPDTPENLDFSLNIPAYRQKLESLTDAFKTRSRLTSGSSLDFSLSLQNLFPIF